MSIANPDLRSPALFLDRDGTLMVDRHYLADPAGVELMPGAKEVLAEFLQHGWRLFLFTNQSGVGRGLFTMATVEACNQRLLELLALPEPGFTAICVAPEAPEEPSLYRKPSPRFITEMIAQHSLDPARTWMVGDRLNDVQTGLNSGVRSAWVSATARSEAAPAGVWCGSNLWEFAGVALAPRT